MKNILFFFILICAGKILNAQTPQGPLIYEIFGDSVKITSDCDTAELIIENHTQNVPGFLFNKGKGRTEFRRPLQKISDSLYLIATDSLRLPNAWLQGGNAFSATGTLGTRDAQPFDIITNNAFRARVSTNGNLLWGTTTEDGRFKMEVQSGSVGALKAQYRLDVWAENNNQLSSIVISNGNFNSYLTLGVAGSYQAWSPYTIPTDAVLSTRPNQRIILSSKSVLIQNNTLIGTSSDDGNKLHVNGTARINDTLKLPGIITKMDTSDFKPMIVDANGNVFRMTAWPVAVQETTVKRTAINDMGYTAQVSDHLIAFTALTAARTVTLPAASQANNKIMIIKDEGGSAAVYNITLNVTAGGTIDGASSKIVSTAYGMIEVYSNGVQWFTK